MFFTCFRLPNRSFNTHSAVLYVSQKNSHTKTKKKREANDRFFSDNSDDKTYSIRSLLYLDVDVLLDSPRNNMV